MVSVYVGVSGTGGGFKRFVTGEIDINDASREIEDVEEALARRYGVRYVEIPIAIDGVVVIVNPGNTWVDSLSIDELRMIWSPDSGVEKWSDIRPEWRTDYIASEDDNVILRGVENDLYGLGYFGLAYYLENMDRVRAVPIDAGEGPVGPSLESVRRFEYPLSRLLYLYVNLDRLDGDPVLREFIAFYLEHAYEAVLEVGYAPLPEAYYRAASAMIREGVYRGLYELAMYWAPSIEVGDESI